MKTLKFMLYVILSISTIPPICRSIDPFLGISPQDEMYYKSGSGTFKCIDGSKKLYISQLNDNFCDCPDASDEPGTSACPNGKFYCRNAGHAPLSLFSSRVNDGICDCCDGSDEYDSQVKCPNTCWEAGKVARDKLIKKIATYQEGVTLRNQEVEQAKLAFAKDKAELSKLKNDEKILKGLVQQLKEQKEQIEKMEEKERLEKEKEEKLKKEAEEKSKPEKKAEENADSGEEKTVETEHHDKIGSLEDSPVDQDVEEDYHDAVVEHSDNSETEEHSDNSETEESPNNGVEQHTVEAEEKSTVEKSTVVTESGIGDSSKEAPDQATHLGDDASDNMESLSREELGRLVASRWTGENSGKETTENAAAKDVHDGHEKTTVDPHDKEDDDDGYSSEIDDDSHKYDDDDVDDHTNEDVTEDDHDVSTSSDKSYSDDESYFSDTETSTNPTWLEKIQQTVRNILQAVNLFKTPVDKSEAAHIRKEYDESSSKLSKIQSRISSLTEKLKLDFGPEMEFYSFYNRCFESKENKYVYKVCPYKQASQVEGHSTTRLGRWDKFEESYRVMVFSNGDKCWNGPDRSLRVKLRCGLQNEVADVDEPSRCEYVALLSTPSLCLEEKLKELQQKLESMNKQQPQTHDEL